MALMKSFFKGKKGKTGQTGEKIKVETLQQLIPVRNLSLEKLEAFSLEKHTEIIKAGEQLFEIDTAADSAIYLLSGIVTVTDKKGNSYDVDASTAQARFPLCSGSKHITSGIAKTDINILQVSLRIMSVTNAIAHDELIIPAGLKNNRLLQLFAQYFMDEKLIIPTLPDIAIRLRKAMLKDIGIAEAVNIVQLDSVISAKLIEVANCPLYLTSHPAKSCHDAVTRIGLNGTRNLVTTFSLKQIFNSRSPDIKTQLDRLWKSSIKLSCLSYILAEESKQYNPEEALLAGLVCDIGAIPFLTFVADLPKEFHNPQEIAQALPVVKGVVGASVLKNWNFTDEFIQVALYSNDWYQNSSTELSLTDIVVLSRLHRRISRNVEDALPAITSIPAASKLKNIALSPENTLHILHDAKTKINEALSAFSS
jgi:HD-like signal output (HDOD) protein